MALSRLPARTYSDQVGEEDGARETSRETGAEEDEDGADPANHHLHRPQDEQVEDDGHHQME